MNSFPKTGLTHFCRDEASVLHLAAWLAPQFEAGDVVFLNGDLGAGKTTFARGVIRALCGPDTAVPSPTFSLVQHYDSPGGAILHADLYRLEVSEEAVELDLFSTEGLVLVEWGDILLEAGAAPALTGGRIDLDFIEHQGGRKITLRAGEEVMKRFSDFAAFSARTEAADKFISKAGYGEALRQPVAGDASSRRYARLTGQDGSPVMFMDWPQNGPANPYAEAVGLGTKTASFTAVAEYLRDQGLRAPEILRADLDNGFLLLEDFGDIAMTTLIDNASPFLSAVYGEAVEALIRLYDLTPPACLGDGAESHSLAVLDRHVLAHEVGLFTQWYLPHLGVDLSGQDKADWEMLWQDLFDRLEAAILPQVLVLRDYHSPNIMWRAELQGIARLGMIDVQDALIGSPAYDLVSLLQDARRDVAPAQVQHSYAQYLNATGCDPAALACHYHIFGAQRNLRIAGVFARLAERDGRPQYLQHLPRVLGYVTAALAHPDLKALADWLGRVVPDRMDR
ncbi:MAG: tRNA (adenosine(37)-N6)-threonylcarbamoyltransferase complex ATPase subunit type 1 TsaE [Parvibaculales bacterium]